MADHERIWLQHPDDVDIGYRQWWEDKGWPQKTIGDPTEYVRSDLFEALRTRLADIEKSRDIHLRSAATHFADSCRLAARAEAAEARAGRLEKALASVRAHFVVVLGFSPQSIMVEGIDAALTEEKP